MTSSRLEELRKVAEQATPGPWKPELRVSNFCRIVEVADPETCIAETGSWAPRHFDEMVANASFIATFNPAVVLELLDTIKTLREALEPFAKCAEGLWESGHCGGASPKDFPDKWDVYLHFGPDFYRPQEFNKFTVGDLRRAHAALTSAGEKT